MKKNILAAMLFCGIIIACSKSDSGSSSGYTEDCSGAAKSYSSDVSPIIQSFCAVSGCHASGSSNGPGALITYQQVYDARVSIRSAVVGGIMPQGSNLSSSQKNNIVCWIDSGASNN